MPQVLSTDPNWGRDASPLPATSSRVLSTDPNWGAAPEAPHPHARIGAMVEDVAAGALKGAGRTAFGLGKFWHDYTPIGRISDAIQPGAFDQLPSGLEATNTAQRVGMTAEQVGEFFIPTGVVSKLPKAAAEVAKAAVLTKAQGGTSGEAGAAGAVSAVIPGAGAAARVGRAIESKAAPLVRAALKPTVSAMKRVAGASVEGIEAKAEQLVRFIIDNRVTTAEKARKIITESEQELQRILAVKNAPTDAPTRAMRYLDSLERNAKRQALPDSDVAMIRNAAAETLRNSLGEDVVTMVAKAHPTLVDASGKPIQVLVPQTTRVLKGSMPATEAMELARGTSQHATKKAWGEMKGAEMEAAKAVERAARDAVKTAIPETREVLAKQGKALQAREVLDRAEFRAANRDAVSLPAHVVAAGELAAGKIPVMALGANWLRNNQLKAGIWADRLGKALAENKPREVADILKRFGVGVSAQMLKPVPQP